MTSEAMGALLETLGRLWPGGTPRCTTRRGLRSVPNNPCFVAIPSAANPRVLVPLENRVAAARSMQRFSSALTLGEVGKRVLVGSLLRTGGNRLMRDLVVVDGVDESASLRAHLSEILHQPVSFSVSVGSARVNRKPILQIFDAAGGNLAFAKLGISQVSEADVRNESCALDALAATTFRHLEVPRPVYSGSWNGVYVLVMTAIATSPFQHPKWRSQPPTTAMDELATAFDQGMQTLDGTAWWERLLTPAAGIDNAELHGRYVELAGRLLDRAGGRSFPIGAWHGDWTSWNMARRRDIVQVWDWERFQFGVPAGLDRLHYFVNEFARGPATSVGDVFAGLAAAGADRSDHRSCAYSLAGAYLLTLTHRYLSFAQGDGGELIRRQADTMMEAVTRWLD